MQPFSFLIAQNNPPFVEWDFSSQSTVPGFELDDNWAHTIIQGSDGNFIAAGFSDKYGAGVTTGFRHPAILKYNPGRTIVWEKIPTNDLGIVLANSAAGGFTDVIETSEAGTRYLYACGAIVTPTKPRVAVVAKFHYTTGNLVYFNQINVQSTSKDVFFRISAVASGNTISSIYICGTTQLSGDIEKATIYRVNPSTGLLDSGFDSDGWKQYPDPGNISHVSKFRDLTPDGSGGFVAVGSVGVNPYPNQPQRDVWAVRLNSAGVIQWTKRFSESTAISSVGYMDLNQASETPFCTGIPTTETGNEEAWGVRRTADGNLALCCRFDWIELASPALPMGGGCWPFNTEQYYDCDLAVIKLNNANGNLLYGIDGGRSVAVDNWAPMVMNPAGTELYLCASLFVPDNNPNINNDEIWGSVVKVLDEPGISQFTNRWRRDVKGLDFEFCPFGICLARDGGAVLCGNNAFNGDDYEFIKFASDCQANYAPGNLQTGTTISGTVIWNTPKTVKGVITIPAGAILKIQNTTVSFFNTYLTNDWRTLSQGGGTPSKIVVNPGGKLELSNAILTGINQCGRNWMWEGVVVKGQPNVQQSTANQGVFTLSNNARIENAYIGITVDNPYYNGIGRAVSPGTEGGGIVQSIMPAGNTAVHFQNCRRGIWFAPFNHISESSPIEFIWRTNFLNNAPLADVNFVDKDGFDIGPAFHLGSWDRDNIDVSISSFRSTWAGFAPNQRGYGADNFDARMTFTNCTFEQLYKGVKAAYGVGVTDPLSMTGCTFTQVRHGVHALAGAFHSLTNNQFLQIPVNLFNDNSYGIRCEGSTNLNISAGNTFSTTNTGVYGVLVTNSYTNASSISGNTFTGPDFGVQTEQSNQGLQIRCNAHSGEDMAWSINPQSPGAGLLSNQGQCGVANIQAGNVFSDPDCPGGGLPNSHIASTVAFAYSARSPLSSFPDEIPTCVSPIVTIVQCLGTSNSNSCNTGGGGGCNPCPLSALEETAQNTPDAWDQQILYNTLIHHLPDSGMADQVPMKVQQAFPGDKLLQIGAQINGGSVDLAYALIEELPEETPEEKEEKQFFSLLHAASSTGNGIGSLAESAVPALLVIAKGHSKVKYAAQAILGYKFGIEVTNPVETWGAGMQDGSEDRANLNTESNDIVTITPNPANVEFRVTAPLASSLEIYSISGVLLYETKTSGTLTTVPVTDFASGLYLLKASSKNGISNHLIIIQH